MTYHLAFYTYLRRLTYFSFFIHLFCFQSYAQLETPLDVCDWTCGERIIKQHINLETLGVSPERIKIIPLGLASPEEEGKIPDFYAAFNYDIETDMYNFTFNTYKNINSFEYRLSAIHEYYHAWVDKQDVEFHATGNAKSVNASGLNFYVSPRLSLAKEQVEVGKTNPEYEVKHVSRGRFRADEALAFRAEYLAAINGALDFAYQKKFSEARAALKIAEKSYQNWQKISEATRYAIEDLKKYLIDEEAALIDNESSQNLKLNVLGKSVYLGRRLPEPESQVSRPEDDSGIEIFFPPNSLSGANFPNGTRTERIWALSEFKRIFGLGENSETYSLIKSLFPENSKLGESNLNAAKEIILSLESKHVTNQTEVHYLNIFKDFLKNIYIFHPAVRQLYLSQYTRPGLVKSAVPTEGELTQAMIHSIDMSEDSKLRTLITQIGQDVFRGGPRHTLTSGGLFLLESYDYTYNWGSTYNCNQVSGESSYYISQSEFNLLYELCALGRTGTSLNEEQLRNSLHQKILQTNFSAFDAAVRAKQSYYTYQYSDPVSSAYWWYYSVFMSSLFAEKYAFTQEVSFDVAYKSLRNIWERKRAEEIVLGPQTLRSKLVLMGNKPYYPIEFENIDWAPFSNIAQSNLELAILAELSVANNFLPFAGRAKARSAYISDDLMRHIVPIYYPQISNIRYIVNDATPFSFAYYLYTPELTNLYTNIYYLMNGIFTPLY